jgi:hypothetical protein
MIGNAMIHNALRKRTPPRLVSLLHRHRNLRDGRSQLPAADRKMLRPCWSCFVLDAARRIAPRPIHREVSRGMHFGLQPPVTGQNGRPAWVCPTPNSLRSWFSWRTHRHNRQPGCQTTPTIRFNSMRDIRYITAFSSPLWNKPALPDGPLNPGLKAGHVRLFPVGTARRLLRKMCAARASAWGLSQRSPRNRTRLPRRATIRKSRRIKKLREPSLDAPSQPFDTACPLIVLEG